MTKNSNQIRCRSCGKRITRHDSVARVSIGKTYGAEHGLDTFDLGHEYGLFHEGCALIALGDRDALLRSLDLDVA